MKKNKIYMLFIAIFLLVAVNVQIAFASDEHGDHGEAEGGAVGEGKGISHKGPLGLQFSPEALQTMAPTYFDILGSDAVLPAAAIVYVKDTKSVFRVRDGWYKRVDVELIRKQEKSVVIKSNELKAGDKIVVKNVGFFRVAEVISVEGAAHSH